MDIKSILALEEENPNTINLVLSGVFLKVYNRSFYILTEILGRELKASKRHIKSAGNRFVVSGGFPDFRIEVHYPQAIKTSWGYQIIGDYDTKGYAHWLLRQESAAQAVGSGVTAVAGSRGHLCPHEAARPAVNKVVQKTTDISLPLSKQQVAYLLTWQRGNHPIEVDLGFIDSLSEQIISMYSC